MDESQAKPNINMKKKAAMGEARAGGSVAGKSLKPDSEIDKVVAKVRDAESVLVALSNDPSVDEIAAAMGLSMALDSAGKHVTAIYSGKTPNVLQFLKPEERFETGTESLQDFVIALNKDKADHLRYKIDGDFVKVYVTPYKTTISGDDIEFSRGDYNVDLVISLNVPAATELDSALKEHGRIMHDATSINITNGAAGKFGDLEWVDPNASSISEMVAKLAFEIEEKMDAATATALLTGLVAATDRFSNPATTPDAMVLAAKLMGRGRINNWWCGMCRGKWCLMALAGAFGKRKRLRRRRAKISRSWRLAMTRWKKSRSRRLCRPRSRRKKCQA